MLLVESGSSTRLTSAMVIGSLQCASVAVKKGATGILSSCRFSAAFLQLIH